jgi:hypothetical protein
MATGDVTLATSPEPGDVDLAKVSAANGQPVQHCRADVTHDVVASSCVREDQEAMSRLRLGGDALAPRVHPATQPYEVAVLDLPLHFQPR